MTPGTLYRMAPPLISFQFVAFCWAVNQEIKAMTLRNSQYSRHLT